jgi:hypothetical protein
MTRNEYMRFSILFQPLVIFVNSKELSIKSVNARGRTLGHFILVIMLLLFMSCSSRQIVELTDDCLITKGEKDKGRILNIKYSDRIRRCRYKGQR